MLLTILRSLIWVWPFISEMFFAGKSFKTILLERWGLALLLIILTLSLFLNYVSLQKIYKIAVDGGKPNSTPAKTDPAKQHDRDVEEAKEKLRNIYTGVAP